MNLKPHLESYGSLIFYEVNLKRARVIIKHRHEFFNVSQTIKSEDIFYLTSGACGADRSTLVTLLFSGRVKIVL